MPPTAPVMRDWVPEPGITSLGGDPSIYLAWRQTQHLPRLATSPGFVSLGGEPSVCLAWRRTQHLPRLVANPGFISLGGEPRFYLAWRRAQVLSRLATNPAFTSLGSEPSVYLAWRLFHEKKPPEGGFDAQFLKRALFMPTSIIICRPMAKLRSSRPNLG